MVEEKLYEALKKRNITIYKLAKMIDMHYEALRRVFAFQRKLTANELVKILKCTGIDFKEIS